MNRIDEEGIRRGLAEIKGIKLTAAEKQNIKNRIMAKIATQPVESPYSAPTYIAFRWVRVRKTVAVTVAAALVAVLGGGSAAFAAEEALPGDLLYPVKVYINEPIRSAAAFGTKAEAKWEAKRAERRLEEAEVLAAEGKFNEESRAVLEMHFDKSAEKFLEAIEKMQEEDGDDAEEFRLGFETRLAAHSRVLGHIEEYADDSHKSEIATIRVKVEERSGRFGSGVATMAAKAVPEAAMMLMQADVSLEAADASASNESDKPARSRYDADDIEDLIEETEERLRNVKRVDNSVQSALFNHTEEKLEEARDLLRKAKRDGGLVDDVLGNVRRAAEEAGIYLDRGSELGGSHTRNDDRNEKEEEDDSLIGEVKGVVVDVKKTIGDADKGDSDSGSESENVSSEDDKKSGSSDSEEKENIEDENEEEGGTVDSVIESATGIKLKTGL